MPAAKRCKTEEQRQKCSSCNTIRVSSDFPDNCPTNQCQHNIHICTQCLQQRIATQLSNTASQEIRCPECEEVMQQSDVHRFATQKDAQIYDRRKDLHEKHQHDKWRWCPDQHCSSGQVHVSPQHDFFKLQQPPDMFTCVACGMRMCVPCNRPWHEDETCYEYRLRTHWA